MLLVGNNGEEDAVREMRVGEACILSSWFRLGEMQDVEFDRVGRWMSEERWNDGSIMIVCRIQA